MSDKQHLWIPPRSSSVQKLAHFWHFTKPYHWFKRSRRGVKHSCHITTSPFSSKKKHLCMSETSAPCCSFHVWFPKISQWEVEQTLHREAVTSCFLSNSNHSIKAFMVGTMNEAINWPLVLGKGQQVVNWLGSWMCSEAGTEINPPFLMKYYTDY